jgi:hypothetical protein
MNDYDTLFLNLAARGYHFSIANWPGPQTDPRNPWHVEIIGEDSHGRSHIYTGHGPTAYFALLAARAHLDSTLREAEKAPLIRRPKAVLGFGSKTPSAATLLAELEL